MKEIDTIREALELAMEYVGTEGGMMTRQEAKLQIALKQALAALSTIEAGSKIYEASTNPTSPVHVIGITDAKPQEPSEDAEAFCKRHQYLMSPKIIQAHDDAIKRDCADRAEEYIESRSCINIRSDEIRTAILATEPAREEP